MPRNHLNCYRPLFRFYRSVRKRRKLPGLPNTSRPGLTSANVICWADSISYFYSRLEARQIIGRLLCRGTAFTFRPLPFLLLLPLSEPPQQLHHLRPGPRSAFPPRRQFYHQLLAPKIANFTLHSGPISVADQDKQGRGIGIQLIFKEFLGIFSLSGTAAANQRPDPGPTARDSGGRATDQSGRAGD